MADDVLLNKAAAIERSVRRAREEQKLNLDIVRHILVERLDDFLEFTGVLLRDDDTPSEEARE